MRVAALAALTALIAFPTLAAETSSQSHPQLTCNNNGRCTTFGTSASIAIEWKRVRTPLSTIRHPRDLDANGNTVGVVISLRTGAQARVGITYAARFQEFIDDLETNYGARVLFMGGLRPGHCSSSSQHPCGKALDLCQRRRGVVDARCNLPGRTALAQIAASHGLFEGGRWCNSDYGHVQVGVTAAACGDARVRIVQGATDQR